MAKRGWSDEAKIKRFGSLENWRKWLAEIGSRGGSKTNSETKSPKGRAALDSNRNKEHAEKTIVAYQKKASENRLRDK